MLVPIFTLKLNQKILPRLVTVGHYDGKHPSLTAATNGGKVVSILITVHLLNIHTLALRSDPCVLRVYDKTRYSLLHIFLPVQVFMHTPHRRMSSPSTTPTARLSVSSSDSDITLLSIGQHVTSLAAGKLDPELDQDVLVVGSQTNVLAYDVEQNSELFYKEVRGRGRVGCGLPSGMHDK